jgi:hypothetical protein
MTTELDHHWLDDVGREAAVALRERVERAVDVDEAFARMTATQATTLSLVPPTRHRRRTLVIAGGIAAAAALVTVVAIQMLDDEQDDPERITPATEVTVPSSPDSTVVDDRDSSPTTSPATTAAPAPAPEGAAAVNVWPVTEPGMSRIVAHPGSTPSWLTLSHGGTQVEAFNVAATGDGSGFAWGPAGSIVPRDATGSPVTLVDLDTGILAALGVTADGGVVWLDPWTLGSGALEHPGTVTDTAVATGNPPLESFAVGFFAVGADDGRPVIWYDDGLVAPGAQNAALVGQPRTTILAEGEPGATGRAMVVAEWSGRAGHDFAYALLPEPDGTSRLWLARPPGTGDDARRTDVVFQAPTGLEASGNTLWVSDALGVHEIVFDTQLTPDAWPVVTSDLLVTADPYRIVDHQGFDDGSAFVLTPGREVLRVTSDGTFEPILQDDLLTEVSVSWNGPGTSPALFVAREDGVFSIVGGLLSGVAFDGAD